MASIVWASSVRCDYPACQSIADVTMNMENMQRTLPPGWTDLATAAVTLRSPFGEEIRELCSIHSAYSIEKIVETWGLRGKPDG